MTVFAILFVMALIVQDIALILLTWFNFKHYKKPEIQQWPSVSVLIPSRNEEANIAACLDAISRLDYPPDKLQLILGNDGSTDRTAAIIESWMNSTKLEVKYVDIENSIPGLNGKASALEQMAKFATGEILLFTDADCRPNPNWVKSMVSAQIASGAALVTGITKVGGNSWFAQMQEIDWWLTLGMVKSMSDLGLNLTSMGNNMLLTKKAYDAVGGFEGLPFSLTEDFEMARQVKKLGFDHVHHVSSDNLISTKGQKSFLGLLSQRKRWMAGAMALPWAWKLLLGFQVMFFPSILILVFLHPFEAILIWLAKVLIQGLFVYGFALKTASKLKIRHLLLLEIYYMITSWSTIVYYFWPAKTDWKGRKYG